MCKRRYFIASALLLQGSLWYPDSMWWATFVWLAPLFFVVLAYPRGLTWRDGLLWGVSFFSLHLISVVDYCQCHAHGIGRFIFPPFLILYCALHAAVWFLCAHMTERLLGQKTGVRVGAWLLWSVAYILFLPHGLLWITGQFVGYPLCFPLLPLASCPSSLYLLPVLGRLVLVVCQCACSLGVALVCSREYRGGFFVIVATLIPFVYGFCVPHTPVRVPHFLQSLGYVCPPVSNNDTPALEVAQDIYYAMSAVVENFPHVSCLVMPELSYRAPLNKQQHIIELWNNNILHNRIALIVGARRRAEDGLDYNSVYYIKEGSVQWWYDKSRLMPLVEYVPSWMKKLPLVGRLFLDGKEFCSCPCAGKICELDSECCVEPYICSDIFLGKDRVDEPVSDNAFILTIMNDCVLDDVMQRLMVLWNVFKALEEHKICLCVGYRGAFIFLPNGDVVAVA